VFDIDGVLIRGKHVLPAAQRALQRLYTADGAEPRLPLAFLTNGGGVTEAQKALQLSQWLGVHVEADQVVLSHTPFRQLSHLHPHPVLVSGRGSVLHVARSYGFAKATSTQQLAYAHPSALPFISEELRGEADANGQAGAESNGTAEAPFKAVLVFNDPSDWYADLQLIMDVVGGGGVLGRRPEDNAPGAPPVDVFFSNPDLLFANEFPAPRFGQGAFAACLEALHQRVSPALGSPPLGGRQLRVVLALRGADRALAVLFARRADDGGAAAVQALRGQAQSGAVSAHRGPTGGAGAAAGAAAAGGGWEGRQRARPAAVPGHLRGRRQPRCGRARRQCSGAPLGQRAGQIRGL
jgi:HAD superfamily hydrolase (TIGR01456 family)